MAYVTKYTGSFKTALDYSIYIEFQLDGYSGASSEIIMADDPLVIAYGNEDELEVIRPSSAHFRLVGTSFRQYDELCTGGNRDWQIIVRADGDIVWQGFIIPSQYVEPYTKSTYILNIIATDGLEGLKDFKYLDSGARYIGLEDLRTIIDNCFTISGVSLDLREALMTYEDSHTSTIAYSPLDQTKIYQERFYDEAKNEVWTCWDVVTEILKPFKAILTIKTSNVGGTLHFLIIEPENMLNDSITIRRGSTSPHVYGTYTTSVEIGANLVLANDDMMLKYGDQYNKGVVNFDLGIMDNILMNGDFIEEKWSSTTQPIYWTKVNSPTVSRDGDAVVLGYETGIFTLEYIYTRIYECWGSVKSLKLSFLYEPTFTDVIAIYYTLIDENGRSYYVTDEEWVSSAAVNQVLPLISGEEYAFEITIPSPPTSGSGSYLELRLRPINIISGTGSVKYSNVKIELTYDDTTNYSRHIKENLIVEEDGNSDTLFIPKEYDIKCGDTGSSLSSRGISLGGFFDTSDNYTTNWAIKNNPNLTIDTIQQLLAWKIANQHSKQLDILEGRLRNKTALYYPYPTILIDPENINEDGIDRKYFPYYMEWNVMNEQSNGYWKELLYKTGSEKVTSWVATPSYTGWISLVHSTNKITQAVSDPSNDCRANTNSISVTANYKTVIKITLTDISTASDLPVIKWGSDIISAGWGETGIIITESSTTTKELNVISNLDTSVFSLEASIKLVTGY